jgi:hypothetical protein
MPRWTVSVGSDEITIERTPTGLVAVSIPCRREVIATREEVEDLRRKLGAAIAVPGEDEGGSDAAR